MICVECKNNFVITNKIKYTKKCPVCNHDIKLSNKKEQIQQMKEQHENQRINDKLRFDLFGEVIIRSRGV